MNTMNETAPERREIEDLLPWHAAGTLSRRDAKRVEDVLARDPELARRYELVREELGETIRLNESLGAPSARAMQTLFKKIDAEPARLRLPSLNLAARLAEFLAGFSPRTLAYSASAAALAIMLQAGIIAGVMLKDRPGTTGGYQTASAPEAVDAAAAGSFVMVRFAPQASAADITAFLAANKLTVAGGPLAGGLYRVKVAMTGLPKAEIAKIAKELQQNKTIEFVATVD